jgi:outer membrane biosynthesis protein TonB
MATAAAKKTSAPMPGGTPRPKIMRIGIVQGGRIVEERLVRTRENITIGQSAKNVFVVPSDTLPKEWLLFQATPKGYVGHFADAMDARIAVGNEVISLAQLKQAGRIRKQGSSWVMLLDERSRGKITVGDMTILFQFVTPPPPQPRPQLPPSVRGTLTSNLDWFFTTIAVASFVAHLGMALYLANVDWPRRPDIEEIPDRFVQMIVKPKPAEPPPVVEEKKAEPEKKAEAPAEKKPAAKPVATPKKELTPEERQRQAEAKAQADAERRARLAEAVRNTGVLKILGARADGEGSIADVLGRGDVDRDQEKAFQGVGGLQVATGEGQLRGIKQGGSGSGKVQSVTGLRGGGQIAGATTGTVGAERRVTGVVRQDAPPTIDGDLDPNVVAKEVRTRMAAIRGCYERALKRNPNLGGKLLLRWTITRAGTVSGVSVEQDTLGDSEVSTCIKSLIARWRFPAPAGGEVEVSFPFVFLSSQ